MLTVNYCKNGIPVSDFVAESLLQELISYDFDNKYSVSTENLISWIRVYVAEGKLSNEKVQLQFEGDNVIMNEFAVIKEWKNGFCDYSEDHAIRILQSTINKRARDRRDDKFY